MHSKLTTATVSNNKTAFKFNRIMMSTNIGSRCKKRRKIMNIGKIFIFYCQWHAWCMSVRRYQFSTILFCFVYLFVLKQNNKNNKKIWRSTTFPTFKVEIKAHLINSYINWNAGRSIVRSVCFWTKTCFGFSNNKICVRLFGFVGNATDRPLCNTFFSHT